jgi:DNA-binding beta-propeller fold protein YncE
MDSRRMGDKHLMLGFIGITMILALLGLTGISQADPILARLHTITTVASTVPANGDINPYGVARVEQSVGNLKEGHILVSNFNNFNNQQGTGSTIVDVAPNGTVSLFAQIDANALPGFCPGGVGLTTALVVLRSGWVIVGSLPTSDGTAATAQAGCLIVLDSKGNPVETFFGTLINGPWDMVAFESDNQAKLFVTNVLNDTVAGGGDVVNEGTVVRINLKVSKKKMPEVQSITVIGSGFAERTDPAALVIGPTGVGISPLYKELYVADSLNNRIAVIEDAVDRTTSAGTGTTLSKKGSLNDPLGLVVTPNGHILTVNGNDGFIIEITPQGDQVFKTLLDNTGSPPGAGTLFGLAFDPSAGVYFVDDGTNTLNLLQKH